MRFVRNRTDALYDVEAQFYDALSGSYVDDVELVRALACETGGPILELMSGTGRVLLPLAMEGYEVWGVDVNEAMGRRAMEKLSREAGDVAAKVHLVTADVRTFKLGRKFPLIVIPYGSFLHLVGERDRDACLRAVVDHLESDGRFMVAVENFPTRRPRFPARVATIARIFHTGFASRILRRGDGPRYAMGIVWLLLNLFGTWVVKHPRGQIGRVRLVRTRTAEDLLCVEFETLDSLTRRSRRDEVYVVIGERRMTIQRAATELAVISREEMERSLNHNGLVVLSLMGGYDGRPFESNSPIQVYLCGRNPVGGEREPVHGLAEGSVRMTDTAADGVKKNSFVG